MLGVGGPMKIDISDEYRIFECFFLAGKGFGFGFVYSVWGSGSEVSRVGATFVITHAIVSS